jgi:diguanylate cyclase (GGDEF)-like protein
MQAASPAEAASPARDLIERGMVEMRTDPDASKRDAESALTLLKRTPDPDLEVRARLLLCDYQSERDISAAEEQMKAATALLPHVKREGLRAGVMLCSGSILETAGESAKALEQYRRAVALATSVHDDDMLAEGRFQLGYLYGVRGDYANGLAQLRQSETLFEELHRPLHALAALNSIAILYNRIGEYGQAQHLYARVLEAQTDAGLTRERAVTLNNLGHADENLHDWEAARQAYTECMEISAQIGYLRAQAYALRGLAAVANARNDAVGALRILQHAEQLQPQTPDARLHANIQLERGIALHKLGRLTESALALEEAVQILRQADARQELSTTYSQLAAVYAAARNWRAAYEEQTRAKSLSDELLKKQLDLRFAALKVEFDTTAKEQEYQALLRESKANTQALAQSRSVRHLQWVVISLMVLLVLLSAILGILQHRATRRMQRLAMTDELTGVPNRRAVLASLANVLESADDATSVLSIDIDHFKDINDDHGHPVGDEVLKIVAARLKAGLKPSAFFGRVGGEEFLVVLPATELAAAAQVAEALRSSIALADVALVLPDRNITASIGVTAASPRIDTTSTLMKRADKALYAAKHGGRNCVKTVPDRPEARAEPGKMPRERGLEVPREHGTGIAPDGATGLPDPWAVRTDGRDAATSPGVRC